MAWMKRVVRWLSLLLVLMLLTLVLAWQQLDRLLPWVVNDLWQDPAVRITRLQGTRLSTTTLQIGRLDLEVAQQPLGFDGIRVTFDHQQPYWVTSVAIAAGEARLDLPALRRRLGENTDTTAQSTPPAVSHWLALIPKLSLANFRLDLQLDGQRLPPLMIERVGWQPGAQPRWQTAIRIGETPWLTVDAALSQPDRLAGDFTLALAPVNQLLPLFSPLPARLAGHDSGRFTLDWSRGLDAWSLQSEHQLQQLQLALNAPELAWSFDGTVQLEADGMSARASLVPGARLSQQLTQAQWPALAERLAMPDKWRDVVAAGLPLSGEVTLRQPLAANLWPVPALTGGALDWQLAGQGLALAGEASELRYAAPTLSADWQLNAEGQGPWLSAVMAANETPVTASRLAFEGQGRVVAGVESGRLQIAPASQLIIDQPAAETLAAEHLTLSLDEPAGLAWQAGKGVAPGVFSLRSQLSQVTGPQLQLTGLTGQHGIRYEVARLVTDSQWLAEDWPFASHHEITGLGSGVSGEAIRVAGQVRVKPQPLAAPWSWWQAPPPLFSLDANLGIALDYRFAPATKVLTASLGAQLSDGSGSYDELRFDGLSGRVDCRLADAQLRCERLEGALESFDGGVEITALSGRGELQASADNWQLSLANARGELLDGAFSTDNLRVKGGEPVTGVLQLQHISLAALVALQKQEGISVSGFLDGELPFTLDTQGFRIDGGRLSNQPPGGEIRINGNPAIDQLRLSQPQLEYALNALEWLDYDELTTDIDYQADGLATLAVSIRGRNPDITRPIHFNYSHEENLLQLLKSLRIGDELSEKIGEQFNQEE